MNDLVIAGSGGFAREVHELVEWINQDKSTWNFLGFLDTNEKVHGNEIHDYPILGNMEWLNHFPKTKVVFAVGDPVIKYKFFNKMMNKSQLNFATLIHPRVLINKRVKINPGTIICEGVTMTTNIEIGMHVLCDRNCTIGHDSVISNFATISPGSAISGNVHIDECSYLGTNSTIIQGIHIGKWSIIGAGAVVVENIPSNVTAVGVPAKLIKQREEFWFEQLIN